MASGPLSGIGDGRFQMGWVILVSGWVIQGQCSEELDKEWEAVGSERMEAVAMGGSG